MIKNWYNGLLITQKLRILLMLGATIAVIFFGVAYTYWGIVSLRNGLISGAESTANLMGSGLVASIRFNETAFALDKLQKMMPDQTYKKACVFKGTGEIFVKYPDGVECAKKVALWNGTFEEGIKQGDKEFAVTKNIWSDGQSVGVIEVSRSEDAVTQYLQKQGKAMAILASVCLLVCYIIANYLQKIISKPIVDMAFDAELICSLQRYDQRLVANAADEIGKLANAFNNAIAFMHGKNQELMGAYEDLKKAHQLTIQKLEEIVEEFSEPADSFMVYAQMSRKLAEGSRTQFEYQKDVMDSISEYQIRLTSTSRMASIYHTAISEPKIRLGLIEYISKYQHDLRVMMPGLPVEMSGQRSHTSEKIILLVHKSAWDEFFRLYSQLVISMVDLARFPVKLQLSLVEEASELTLSLMNKNLKSLTDQNASLLSLCELSVFDDGTAYAYNTIDDPEVGEEFFDDESLPRRDVKFILDSLSYIANANNISVDHYFNQNCFVLKLKLQNLSYTQVQQRHLRVC